MKVSTFLLQTKKVGITFFFMFMMLFANSQDAVTPPINSDIPLNLSSNVLGQTANDIWEQTSCLSFKAAVNEYGISWSFIDICNSISSVSSIAFANEVISPDVAIVKYRGSDFPFTETFYALVVYYGPTDDNYYLQPWLFDVNASGGPTLVPFAGTGSIYPLALDASGPDPVFNGIRIDANKNGEFVIVLENVETHELKAGAGHFDLTLGEPIMSLNMMNTFQREVTLSSAVIWNPYQPDAAIQESRELDEGEVYITFLGDDSFVGYTDIHVISETFLDIWNGTMASPSSPNILAKESCTLGTDFFERPRTAASGGDYTNLDWTVVWRYVDGSLGESHIRGLSRPDLENPHPHNYTNDTEPKPNELGFDLPMNQYHKNPTVSYGFNQDETVAQIAWQGGWDEPVDYSNTPPNPGPPNNGSGGETIISITINRSGDFIRCNGNSDVTYKMVTNPASTDFPSLAGRHSSYSETMNITWWNDNTPDVYEKDFQWCDASFRPSHTTLHTISRRSYQRNSKLAVGPNISVYPNPSNSTVKLNFSSIDNTLPYTLTITDITGRIMASATGKSNYLERAGATAIADLKGGMYVMNITDHGRVVSTHKIIRL